MRGKIGEVHEYSYIVRNWLRRKGVVEKEGVKKEKCQEDEQL